MIVEVSAEHPRKPAHRNGIRSCGQMVEANGSNERSNVPADARNQDELFLIKEDEGAIA
jgi:hypothetical protein